MLHLQICSRMSGRPLSNGLTKCHVRTYLDATLKDEVTECFIHKSIRKCPDVMVKWNALFAYASADVWTHIYMV
jgi:hypothetical protein